jgi:Secretion system C-terminal sorting domain
LPLYTRMFTVLATIVIVTQLSFAWPGDPTQNIPLSEEYTTIQSPTVVALSDGGYYCAWVEDPMGECYCKIQRFSRDGELLWGEFGTLIFDSGDATGYTEIFLSVDSYDNVIAFVTIDGNTPPTQMLLFKLSPNGDHLWNPTGIHLEDDSYDWPISYSMLINSNDDLYVGYTRETEDWTYQVRIKKFGSDGELSWAAPFDLIAEDYGSYDSFALVSSGDDGFIVRYNDVIILPPFQIRQNIMAQRFDENGASLWAEPAMLSYESRLQAWKAVKDISDNNGGLISCWTEARDGSLLEGFAQRVSPDGNVQWAENGFRLMAEPGIIQPSSIQPQYISDGDMAAFVYCHEEPFSFNYNIGMQVLNNSGERQLGTNGITLTETSSYRLFRPELLLIEDDLLLVGRLKDEEDMTYPDYPFGMRFDINGDMAWTTTPAVVSDTEGDIGTIACDQSSHGTNLLIWTDDRTGTNKVYGQNLNSDGTLGDVDLTGFSTIAITSPEENSLYPVGVDLQLQFSCENFTMPDDGFIKLNISGHDEQFITELSYVIPALEAGQIVIEAELVDSNHLPLSFWGDDVKHISVLSTLPSLMILTPQDGFTVYDETVDIETAISNFDIADGQGSIACTLINGDVVETTYLHETSFQLSNLLPGTNSLILELLNADNSSLDPLVLDSIHVNYDTNPQLTVITPEEPNVTVDVNYIDVELSILNFDLTPETGDGKIAIRNHINEDYFTEDFTSELTFRIDDLLPTSNTIEIELVQNDNTPLDPAVTVTIGVSYGSGEMFVRILTPEENYSFDTDSLRISTAIRNFTYTPGPINAGIVSYKWISENDSQVDYIESDTHLFENLPGGDLTMIVELVDRDYNSYDPVVSDTIHVFSTQSGAGEELYSTLPTITELMPAYPNPFNPSINITYNVAQPGVVDLKIYDTLGRLVATLVNESRSPGVYSTVWNNNSISSGMYFIKFSMGNINQTQKIIRMK